MQQNIVKFLQQKHIVILATFADNDYWSAICYYAFDEQQQRLLIRSNLDTRHAQLMLKNPHVTGSIIHDTQTVAKLQGIQFNAEVTLLNGEEKKQALALYHSRFPYARVMKSPIWHILLNEVKFTDNTLGFGKKTLWQREKTADKNSSVF
ncbi:MAG: pyridoxamine 5'-phosphate oxidase family protein [Pasteurellaceae bacterium]|nr:pyridoxamine 5'-phosphate oxidase family protein [Pasteurellaceae bacterium]